MVFIFIYFYLKVYSSHKQIKLFYLRGLRTPGMFAKAGLNFYGTLLLFNHFDHLKMLYCKCIIIHSYGFLCDVYIFLRNWCHSSNTVHLKYSFLTSIRCVTDGKCLY